MEGAILAAITLVPHVLGGRGRVNADTKQYLYLDPVDLLERSLSVWDQRVGGGAVTHQGVGYLWPMGPFYALTDAIGLRDWVAQQIWIGGLQLLAALGALALFRHLLAARWLQVPAAAAYGLSPFVLGHVTGQSGLLVPFAGLPWLVLLMAKAVESPRSWRWPACFALAVTTCGSLNGSSVFFVLLAPVLWVPFALAGSGRAGLHSGLRVLLRTGSLTLVTQLWWLTAYAVGGAYNLPVLDITENVRTTDATTSATEVLRGLGYWYFYGADTGGPWLAGLSRPYLTSARLLAITFAVPILALAAATGLRWRHRAYFVTLIGVGTIIAVGAFPLANPSPSGNAFESLSRNSDLVLSLRNTQRAGALIALGLAGLLAAGLSALERRHARAGGWAAVALAAIVALALPAQWRTGLVAERFHRPEDLPSWWLDAADHLDGGSGRVLELPGIDFASYRWGHTLDPVSVGLTDRPILARELIPYGGAAGVDLLEALDRSIQEGWFEPAALSPVARLLGASEVLVRNDLEYERYRTVRPRVLWPLILDPSTGLGPPTTFEDGYANRASPARPLIDELELGLDHDTPDPPALAVFDVPDGGRTPLSASPVGGGVVVDGDGEGIVAAAAAGLLDDTVGALLLGADVVRAGDRTTVTDGTTQYVLTDTNRKRAKRWYSLRENAGATEPSNSGVVLDDPSDARLRLVGEDVPGAHTVVEWRGAHEIWADSYGSALTLVPEERPSNAFDGDPTTAWRASPNDDGTTRRIGIELDAPVEATGIRLLAPRDRPGTTLPTRVRVTLDGSRRSTVALDQTALNTPAGAFVALDGEPFERLEIAVLDAQNPGDPTGFAEIAIPGVVVEEMVVLPTALVDELGADLVDAPVAIVLTRLRANAAEPVRADPEPSMRRSWSLPVGLVASLTGTARIDTTAPDPVLDALLGAGPDQWPVRVTSTARLAGAIEARASSVLDGDLTTAWQTPLVGVTGQAVTIDLDDPIELSNLEVDLVADGRHSLPTALRVTVDGGRPLTLTIPPVTSPTPGGTAHVSLPFDKPLAGARWQIEVDSVDPLATTDWYSGDPVDLPVGIAEINLPGVPRRPTADVDTGCRTDLLTLRGEPVEVRVTGPAVDAIERRGLALAACDARIPLEAGTTELHTAPGRSTGLALDRLVFESPKAPAAGATNIPAPSVQVRSERPGHVTGEVTTDGERFWLVLDQSMNEGWKLRVDGARVEGPRPLDSYAAGWLVVPDGPGTLEIAADWAPQRTARIALVVSALGVVACLVLALRRSPPALWSPVAEAGIELQPGGPRWLAVGAATLLAALAVAPLAGLGAGGIMLVARRWPWVGRAAPLVLVAASMAAVTVGQLGHEYEAAFEWPTRFPWTHQATLVGVVLLLVVSLPPVERDRRR